jgi:hypothetical protein
MGSIGALLVSSAPFSQYALLLPEASSACDQSIVYRRKGRDLRHPLEPMSRLRVAR